MKPKILVTGADGFIGSHLVELLIASNFSVKAFCQYNSFGNWGWLEHTDQEIKTELEVILGDIRDPISVKNAMQDCEIVLHLAALISIPYSYQAASSYIDTNIKGTLNVLQAAKDLNIRKIVHTSTSEVYGTAQYVPIDENHPLVGQSPYSASKIGADQLAISFWKSFQTPVSIIRPFNTFGPRQSSRAVIPAIITQIASGKKEINLGSLSPTRDFNYVRSTCDGFIAIMNSEKTIGRVINASSNFEISIGETVKLISEIMNQKVEIISDENRKRPTNSEVYRLFGDNKLLKSLTEWNSEYSGLSGFKKGLKITIDWFSDKENLKLYKPDNYSI